ncbi:unnamed protein product, partial [Oncorhynchus mykiss]
FFCVDRMLPEVGRIPFYWPGQGRGCELGLGLGQGGMKTTNEPHSRYDLDDIDVSWLELVNLEFRELALPELDELTMERVLVELESQCEENMQQAIETEEGLGIEYDEDVVCDVCRSPEGEDGNEMVFCDKCNICVHQACYGILKVPQGSWLCRTCALGVQPKCLLCPKRGGALKPTRSGTKWVHVSCALWIPEVSPLGTHTCTHKYVNTHIIHMHSHSSTHTYFLKALHVLIPLDLFHILLCYSLNSKWIKCCFFTHLHTITHNYKGNFSQMY